MGKTQAMLESVVWTMKTSRPPRTLVYAHAGWYASDLATRFCEMVEAAGMCFERTSKNTVTVGECRVDFHPISESRRAEMGISRDTPIRYDNSVFEARR